MSGVKVYPMYAGAAAGVGIALAATMLAGGAVVAGGVTIAKTTAKAVKAYQERQKREREAARKQEEDIQRHISLLKSKSQASRQKVAVELPKATAKSESSSAGTQVLSRPSNGPTGVRSKPTQQSETGRSQDLEKKIAEMKARLPRIHEEYQAIITEGLVESTSVYQAMEKAEKALEQKDLSSARAQLRALDDARIEVIQQQQKKWIAQFDYLGERIEQLQGRVPVQALQDLSGDITTAQEQWQQQTDAELQQLHQRITDLAMQAGRVQEAADNLVDSWKSVGYKAYVAEGTPQDTAEGTALVKIVTHEGAVTEMRIQFDGQQVELNGPEEESTSCALRTQEALKIFQEKGYYLEWASLDGQPVPEEWRKIYSVDTSSVQVAEDEAVAQLTEIVKSPSAQNSETVPRKSKKKRRLEGH